MSSALTVSVVVPTYGRPELLPIGLEGLCHQTLPRERFEVLVVDDGSPEPPDEVVARFADRLPVRVLRKDNGGLASARNHGAAQARGDVLLFLDDDIRPCPEFLAAHLAPHERDERVVALGSLPHPPDLPMTPFLHYLDRVRHYDLFLRYGSAEDIPMPPLNGNSSVRRAHFEAVGGYDLGFASYGGEDTEMGVRLGKHGLRFVYAPEARGEHFHVKGWDAYRRDQESSGAAIVAIVARHPELRERVNLDLVQGSLGELRGFKLVRGLTWRLLQRAPVLVRLLELAIARLEPLDLRRALHPAYLVAGHYHFAVGMRDALRRTPLPGPDAAADLKAGRDDPRDAPGEPG